MRTSFAQITSALQTLGIGLVLGLAGCATLPAPTAELSAAQQAVARADAADADQYAAADIAQARDLLAQAQAAMAKGRESDARSLAVTALASADLANARSRAAAADTELMQRRREIADLRQRLQAGSGR
ncbi:MAG: DUF4398 domain-containing protein [Luteimonas sp.]